MIDRTLAGFITTMIENRGRIYACTYAEDYFDQLTDEQIATKVRQEYHSRSTRFRPYNMSTGVYMR